MKNSRHLLIFLLAFGMIASCKEELNNVNANEATADLSTKDLNATTNYTTQSLPTTYSLMYTPSQITYVKAKIASQTQQWYNAYQQLITKANSYANRTHNAVTSFSVPPYYSNTAGHNAAKAPYMGDVDAAYTNALAYILSGDSTYATKAVYFLKAWSSQNTTIATTGDTPLVSAYGGSGFLVAADLLMNTTFWTSAEKLTFKNWVQNKYLPVVNGIKANANNWGDWGTYAVTCAYVILGDEANVDAQVERMKLRIDKHIEADGHMPLEVAREENGVWYTYFALSAMTASAQVALNTTGTNIFTFTSPKGRKLKTALDYLLYYTKHQEEWPWHPMTEKILTSGTQWPLDLFEGVSNPYGSYYNQFTSPFKPIMGGYKGSAITHFAWKFPTLMRTP